MYRNKAVCAYMLRTECVSEMAGSHSLFSHAGMKGLQTAKGYLTSLFSPTAFLYLLISTLDLWLGRIEAKITCISA